MTTTYYCYMSTPVGELLLAGTETALTRIGFPEGKGMMRHDELWTEDPAIFTEVKEQLQAYFDQRLTRFDLPLAPAGTDFQLRVWEALMTIPYGDTSSYGEIAGRMGRPGASRAVGAANGQNPLPIVIPCHRVIGRDGTLTGFGGGLEVKRRLLALEKTAVTGM
ncbi:MAG: methylated-DNA--[protein]-cysteine S-methyltransferase [Pseudohongiellaceae bacterium]